MKEQKGKVGRLTEKEVAGDGDDEQRGEKRLPTSEYHGDGDG